MKGEFDKLGNYFDGDNYIQHNLSIGDGLSGLGKALEEMGTLLNRSPMGNGEGRLQP